MTSSGMARTFIVLRTWGEKGAVLCEITQASRRQYDPDIGRLSDDMPKFCILARFNSRSVRLGATIRRLQRLGRTSL
jgi:hypothetical protein